jgi:hypothetical protein
LEKKKKKGGKMSQGRVSGASASADNDDSAAYDIRDDIYDAEDTLHQHQQQQHDLEEEEERELRAAAQRLDNLLNPSPPPSTTPPPILPPLPVAIAHPSRSLPLPPASSWEISAALQVKSSRFCRDMILLW